MKKNIQLLAKMLAQNRDGTLVGGFKSIKGGFRSQTSLSPDSTNGHCTNTSKCEASTNSRCTK